MREPKTPGKSNSQQFALVCAATLQRGLTMRFQARGQSMKPNVLNGDTVEVAPISVGQPQRGDIVLARGRAGFRLHRIVGWDEVTGRIVTRGDAGQQNDEPTEIVLGKVIAIERNGKKILFGAPGTNLLHAVRTQTRRVLLARDTPRATCALGYGAIRVFAFRIILVRGTCRSTIYDLRCCRADNANRSRRHDHLHPSLDVYRSSSIHAFRWQPRHSDAAGSDQPDLPE